MSDSPFDQYSPKEVQRLIRNRMRRQIASFTDDGIMPDSLSFEQHFTEFERQRSEGATLKSILGLEEKRAIPLIGDSDNTPAISSQEECPCHSGCLIDHGQSGWAKTINQRDNVPHYIEIKEDTGSDSNWIHPKKVQALGLTPKSIQPSEVRGFDGKSYSATRMVKLTLTGRTPKSNRAEFFVAPPGFPVEGATVGTEFIMEHGHVHTLFPSRKEERSVLLAVQSKVSVAK